MSELPRILSCQSSVCFGVVGNSAAVFPMQVRGCDVSRLNTLQYSTQPPYSCGFAGSKTPNEDIVAILEKFTVLGKQMLEASGCKRPLFSHVLSGYLGDAAKVTALADYVRSAKELFPSTFFFFDPVCGDNGRLYVAPAVPEAMQRELMPLADAIKPNLFEAQLFSRVTIVDVESARQAALALHRIGPRIVIISSISLPSTTKHGDAEGSGSQPRRGYTMLSRMRPMTDAEVSAAPASSNQSGTRLVQDYRVFAYPLIDGNYGGTGDTLSALVLSEIALRGENAVEDAVRRALGIMHVLIEDCRQNATPIGGQRELRLIAMRRLFELVEERPTNFNDVVTIENQECVFLS